MKKIKQKINDIRLQNKLVIIYVVTGLIPLIVLLFCILSDEKHSYGQGLKEHQGGN